MYGINANYDATAASSGVPVASRYAAHDDELAAAALDACTAETQATSGSESGLGDEKTHSPADTLVKGDDDHGKAEMARRSSVVQALARSYSRTSGAPADNPFFAEADSPLNPSSASFSGREWAKAVVELVSRDGGNFRSAGVCFQNLNVHGFGASTDYQKDVANVWLSLAALARRATGSGQQRIDILRHFDGIVRSGEMLVVLGPPGSGCSTFLKTISGEMNGIHVGDGSYFNYQGKSLPPAPESFFFFFSSSAAVQKACPRPALAVACRRAGTRDSV